VLQDGFQKAPIRNILVHRDCFLIFGLYPNSLEGGDSKAPNLNKLTDLLSLAHIAIIIKGE